MSGQLLQGQRGALEPIVLTLPNVSIDYTSAAIVLSFAVRYASGRVVTFPSWTITNRSATGATATVVLDGTELQEIGNVVCSVSLTLDGVFVGVRSWNDKVVAR